MRRIGNSRNINVLVKGGGGSTLASKMVESTLAGKKFNKPIIQTTSQNPLDNTIILNLISSPIIIIKDTGEKNGIGGPQIAGRRIQIFSTPLFYSKTKI